VTGALFLFAVVLMWALAYYIDAHDEENDHD
jgi:hypothetical protein